MGWTPEETDWIDEAAEADILSVAKELGANLKKTGINSFHGPCPTCGFKDTFGINLGKKYFVCNKGDAAGNVIKMVMHIQGSDFFSAVEYLTGRPHPDGRKSSLTDKQIADRERRKKEREERLLNESILAEKERAKKHGIVTHIWNNVKPIEDTVAEKYLNNRGIPRPPMGWPSVLGFHEGLEWGPGATFWRDKRVSSGPIYPCLVARVNDKEGALCGVWRIFLDPTTANKAPVADPKLGLGFGGSVRIGGDKRAIGVAEGVETALAAWTLGRYEKPIWSLLSGRGMSGFLPPDFVRKIYIYPDGDVPFFDKKTGKLKEGVGMKYAKMLKERMVHEDVEAIIIDPPRGRDYNDILIERNKLEGIE